MALNSKQLCFLLTLITIIFCFRGTYCASRTEAETVYSSLFSSYIKEIRPGSDQNTPLTVNITYFLLAINSFDEVSGIIDVPSMFSLSWEDEKLTWNPWTNGNLYYLLVPQTALWLPKLYLTTPSKAFKAIGDDEYVLRILFNGYVYWSTGGIIKSTCSPDTTYFPFDTQNCTLNIFAFGYTLDEFKFNVTSKVDLRYFQENGEWELVESVGNGVTVTDDEYETSMAVFEIIIKRRPAYFVVSILCPVVFLVFLNPLVFVLPVESGERMSFCLTILLSFAVFMTLVDDVMPKSSEPAMALVSYYILGTIVQSGFVTVINVFLLAGYHKSDDARVPRILRFLTRKWCCSSNKNRIQKININSTNEPDKNSDNLADDNEVTWKMAISFIDCALFIFCYTLAIASTIGFMVRLIIGK
ncbi:hypothetical protein KUTeg_004561 [Tegillarca granosa]|uniref:Uncharacterized protein n=1 Tax=Tegillarca granosa TaxID=220873 RepID=A0ABQ9FUS1_TEGGR|nr:hypothetical protein KUTeg_004561 [Tegillarca granosa]